MSSEKADHDFGEMGDRLARQRIAIATKELIAAKRDGDHESVKELKDRIVALRKIVAECSETR